MSKVKTYPHIIPDMADWPIHKLSQDRHQFIKEIDDYTIKKLMLKSNDEISDLIAKTIYLERIRIKEEPWKVDPQDDRSFWNKMSKKLVNTSLDKEKEEARTSNEQILAKIINRYSEEIVSTFKPPTFKFARKFLTFFFNRLLNTAASRNYKRIWSSRYNVYEKLQVDGDLDTIRNLFNHGTVVIVPTHFSNLDSIIIGYVMDQIVGLPAFAYGAGLNLFNSGATAYYMNRLGTYRVDRRKKNPIYLETLKAMNNLSIQRGTNNLFFPGGTRARSGALESKLKMGLMGTVVEAQRALCQRGQKEKVFVVPLVLSYHFVLEAKFMIEQHLKKTGKEHYIKNKDSAIKIRQVLKFAWKYFSESNDAIFSFGKPFDVLGNFVDEKGVSHDKHGNVIDIKDYFLNDGVIKTDFQREAEYTKMLADKIVDRFHKENIVLSSHLIAFASFNILRYQNPNLDLYGILRLPQEDYVFPIELILQVVGQLKEKLLEMKEREDIKLSEAIHWDLKSLVKDGVTRLGTFHSDAPLQFNKDGDLVSEDFKILYYYHNRLENYNLDKYIKWTAPKAVSLQEQV